MKVAFVFKMKKLTTQEFIEKAQKIHGERYDYSKVDYKGAHSKVCIICPTHGEFWQKANNHTNGQNCPMCRFAAARTGDFGVGVLDKPLCAKKEKSERTWRQMLRRAYSEDFKRNSKAYEGVSVCEEWKTYSKFKEWFEEHYVEGWALDKDILIKGNKEYGPLACCYVPPQINSLFTKRTRGRGPYPIGVSMCRICTTSVRARCTTTMVASATPTTALACSSAMVATAQAMSARAVYVATSPHIRVSI